MRGMNAKFSFLVLISATQSTFCFQDDSCRVDVVFPENHAVYSGGNLVASVSLDFTEGLCATTVRNDPDAFELCIEWDAWRPSKVTPRSCAPLTGISSLANFVPELEKDDIKILRRFRASLKRTGEFPSAEKVTEVSYFTTNKTCVGAESLEPEKARRISVDESTFTCTGNDIHTGRCIFRDVLFAEGVIWAFTDSPPEQVPPLLCTSANSNNNIGGQNFVRFCEVKFVPVADRARMEAMYQDAKCFVDKAVVFSRLFPSNAYHVVFEDMVPVYSMMRAGLNLSSEPVNAMHDFADSSWAVMFSDSKGQASMDPLFWKELLPEVRLVYTADACWARTLVAGSMNSCGHWGHCEPPEDAEPQFKPRDSAIGFRRLALHRFGFDESVQESFASHNRPPRVTFVQRSSTGRVIRDIETLVSAAKTYLRPESLSVVDMAHFTVQEQLSLAHSTDVFILVHGAALLNMLWLPAGAIVIDIHPYEFTASTSRGVAHSIRRSFAPLVIGHFPFYVLESHGQQLYHKDSAGILTAKPMVENCKCYGEDTDLPLEYSPRWQIFWNTGLVSVNLHRFEVHLQESLERWEKMNLTPPLSKFDFKAMQRNQNVDESPEAPNCWDDCIIEVRVPAAGVVYNMNELVADIGVEFGYGVVTTAVVKMPQDYQLCIVWDIDRAIASPAWCQPLQEGSHDPPRFPNMILGEGPHLFRASLHNIMTNEDVLTQEVLYYVSLG